MTKEQGVSAKHRYKYKHFQTIALKRLFFPSANQKSKKHQNGAQNIASK
jgi:hypothetical protein